MIVGGGSWPSTLSSVSKVTAPLTNLFTFDLYTFQRRREFEPYFHACLILWSAPCQDQRLSLSLVFNLVLALRRKKKSSRMHHETNRSLLLCYRKPASLSFALVFLPFSGDCEA
ncbi:hypothetical protein OUZ56_023229 [Daphnia magna]|uniref:Uncharacterized protein n=1 Tax=Daphnia magna TaxID=35525 RepID=A0ABR0AZB0_9CRUS|nr:hypothetical protein OUZ56_023229 [Daphnia magna]